VADGGTIFLDEVGNYLPQVRLLRVLENGEFIKVGSSQVQKTDVHCRRQPMLIRCHRKGKFREDLYRLSTVDITLPPLRDRKKIFICYSEICC
jgi:transcriptional regulator with PAS, ATPase and Fis domain